MWMEETNQSCTCLEYNNYGKHDECAKGNWQLQRPFDAKINKKKKLRTSKSKVIITKWCTVGIPKYQVSDP